ncbi:MAG: response regulator [Candidatus Omnitrophica bacterium]|nr:response regulator [Candidatus Omnitrophota bacterium]
MSQDSKEIKTLVVDDDPAVLEFLKRFLEQKGFKNILSVKTGKEAIEVVEKERPKLVLLDVRLPDINGVEVLKQIKAKDKDIGVIMITAFSDEDIAKEAMREGAYDYIFKPFDLAYLELSLITKIILMS